MGDVTDALSIFFTVYDFNPNVHSQKKRYKSCHWGCTFSKGKLLYILGVNMYILGANMQILNVNMYISGANMSILL